MKTKHLLSALLILISISFINAQTIHPDSEWRTDAAWWEPDFGIYHHHYKEFISGDTMIDSKLYHKIYSYGYLTFNPWKNAPSIKDNDSTLSGFLREENNKWYTWTDEDVLLYDFNLQVNDTVLSAFTDPEEPIIVTAIDSVLVGSEYKKRFHLNLELGAEYIIEGIGATSGLFENMYFFEWNSELICYSRNGVSMWGATGADCDLILASDEPEAELDHVMIYPNPAHNTIFVSWPESGKSLDATLINAAGIVVKEERLGPLHRNLNIEQLPTGLYFISLDDGSKKFTQKIMIR